MAKIALPSPTTMLSKTDARRFMLAHHRLWPPRRLKGKAGIVDYIRHVGCIQFDPINVVGCNPDLVLQSRVADYRPALLDELLYQDRQLVDGYDKVASVYLAADWPYFARRRDAMRRHYAKTKRSQHAVRAAPDILQLVRQRGPTSSLDLKNLESDDDTNISWAWGRQARFGKAVLDVLYDTGEVGIHHRAGTRRVFDAIERLIPANVLSAPDPNETDEAYLDWHVLRRVGGHGLACPNVPYPWGGIQGAKSRQGREALARLAERGAVVAVAVEDVPKRTFFARAPDLQILNSSQTESPPAEAAVIAALDNLTWRREILRWLFDFDYTWEVYKPAAERRYGYYVLPVLYGDRLVARFEPVCNRKARELTIAGWWWEEGVRPDGAMDAALGDCFQEFARYLDVERVLLGEKVAGKKTLRWVQGL
ncbi:MAG: crosslink repair DNA glycosylase YcaQ family protein [Chloroflexota bacterium]|nr:crosslink repair DNA glycosylase YcaQ family protein [Chloroflexota bacterium]